MLQQIIIQATAWIWVLLRDAVKAFVTQTGLIYEQSMPLSLAISVLF